MSLKHLVHRTAEVYRDRGVTGVARQSIAKIQHIYNVSTFRPHVIDKSLAGHDMRVAINNLFAKGWVEKRVHWPELEWVARHMLRPGDTVVDCGANNGFTTIFFAKCVGPQGRVIAFEPLPRNSADVAQNVQLNGLENVEVRQQAVGRQQGEVLMVDTPNGILSSHATAETIPVPIVPLDDALEGITPSFIKIDVEGHEVEVLAGSRRTLNARPRLDVEVHQFFQGHRPDHLEAIVSLLDEHRYDIAVQPYADGPIGAWDRVAMPASLLAASDVVQLFAAPRASQ